MTTAAIRKKLIDYIAEADEQKVKGLYLLVEDDIQNAASFKLSKKQISFLEEERKEYISGKGKSYSWEEAKQLIRKNRSSS